jgi:2'-5' RNA ligase
MEQNSPCVVDETTPPLPNFLQGLWVVSFIGNMGEHLEGGAVAVTEDDVYYVSSAPDDDANIGLQTGPDDDDEPDNPDDAVNEVEMSALLTLFAAGTEDDYDQTVSIMAVPAQDDPVHDIGPADKHATLLYFGDIPDHADPARMQGSKEWMQEVLGALAEKIPPFTADVTGVEPLGDDDPPAQVWLLDSPNLQDLFGGIRAADDEISELYDGADATRYPEYTPHVTIGYGDDPEEEASETPDEEAQEGDDSPPPLTPEDMAAARGVRTITFDRLSLWWGNEHIDFPLTGDEDTSEFEALFALIASLYGEDPLDPDGGRIVP